MADLAIEATNLSRSFGAIHAVDRLDLEVPAGSVFGFLGPNGSGKTTTIRLVLGLLRADTGTIRVLGRPLAPDPALFARIGALVERPAFYPGLSGRDNLRVFAATARMPKHEAEDAIVQALSLVGLEQASGRHVRGYSTGMLQRLAIGLALLRRPELVILDEPTAGLDPAGVAEVRDLVLALARDGATIFLSSHVLPEVEQVCDRLAIIDHGRLVASGLTADLLERDVRLHLRFDTPDEAARARSVLAAAGRPAKPAGDGADRANSLLLAGLDGHSSEIARLLAEAGLFPAEMAFRRPSLESVFLALTEGAPPEART